jgi:hypothetical protein
MEIMIAGSIMFTIGLMAVVKKYVR